MAKKEETKHLVTPPPFGLKIRFRGIFDIGDYYRWAYFWLDDQDYVDDEHNLETSYIERRKPPIKNYEIVWKAEKEVSSYFTYKIILRFLLVGVQSTEIEVEGEKVKAENGDAQVWIAAHVETPDWKDLGFLHSIYARFIAYRRLQQEKVNLYKDVYTFQSDMKKYLGINQ